jgi:hypothetical protein
MKGLERLVKDLQQKLTIPGERHPPSRLSESSKHRLGRLTDSPEKPPADESATARLVSELSQRAVSHLTDSTEKLLEDFWHSYRSAHRRDHKPLVEKVYAVISDGLKVVDTTNDELGTLEVEFAVKALRRRRWSSWLPTILDVAAAIDGCQRSFIENVSKFAASAAQQKDGAVLDLVVPILNRRFIGHYRQLNALYDKLLRAVGRAFKRHEAPEEEDEGDEGEEDNWQQLVEGATPMPFEQLFDAVRRQRAAVFPVLRKSWVSLSALLDDGDMRSPIPVVFKRDRECLDRLINFWLFVKDNQIGSAFLSLAERHIIALFRDVFAAMKKMWSVAWDQVQKDDAGEDSPIYQDMVAFSKEITDLVELPAGDDLPVFQLPDIAGVFDQFSQWKSFEEMCELDLRMGLSKLVEELKSSLEKKQEDELGIINHIPEQLPSEPEETHEMEEALSALSIRFDENSRSIENDASELLAGLGLCRQAAFRYPQEPAGDDQEGSWQTRFQDGYVVQFCDATHTHLQNLKRAKLDIYSLVMDRVASEHGLAMDDAKIRKVARSKVAQRKAGSSLTLPQVKQVDCLNTAILRTYEQLFAATRGVIIAKARLKDFAKVDEALENITRLDVTYVGELQELKAACANAMDVEETRKVGQRIADGQITRNEELRRCFEVCFRDDIESTIEKYRKGLVEIQDNESDQEHVQRTWVDNRFKELHEKEHFEALVLVEMRYRLDVAKEENRTVAAHVEMQERVRKLLNQGDYDQAEAVKKELNARKADDLKERKSALKKRYDTIRAHKLEEQAQELAALQREFDGRLEAIHVTTRQKMEELKSQVILSLRSVCATWTQFVASRLHLGDSPKGREVARGTQKPDAKDAMNQRKVGKAANRQTALKHQFWDILRAALKENGLDDLIKKFPG